MKQKNSVRFMAEAAMIGAVYALLTIASSIILPSLTFGPIQLRLSEALTILPLFTPAAIPGLFVGCVLSNAAGIAMGANVAGALDILFGSAATLVAAILTRKLRRIAFRGIPFLSLVPPVLLNALVIGLELSLFIPDIAYIYAFFSVGLSEAIVCFAAGIPLFFGIKKSKLFH